MLKPKIRTFFQKHTHFLVAGHKSPDGDCVGSQLALVGALRRMGKIAHAVSPGPFSRLEIHHLAERFLPDPASLPELAKYAAIILDTSTIDRTGELWPMLSQLPMLVIDHHSSRDDFGELQIIDPAAPATALLILQLMEELGYPPDRAEAELLLLGICTDTGFFRHLESGAPAAFAAVSRLTAAGASVKEAFLRMFGGVNLAERQLLGKLLQNSEAHYSGKLVFAFLSLEDRQSLGPMNMKTEEVYRLLQMIEGIQVLVFMKQDDPQNFSVSFRSHGQPRVDLLAAELGGGGHQAASGCELQGTYSDIKQQILTVCAPYFLT